jgi:6,7-dimethyl-8-ribityllumazine synthase
MASDDRVALCVARFYAELADALEQGARDALAEAGITQVDVFALISRYAAESGRYAAIVALGAVIRGETDHYNYVCSETARGLQDVQLTTGVPIGFGVLTVDNAEQARARVKGGSKRDSGGHAAEAALAALAVKRELTQRPRQAGFAV